MTNIGGEANVVLAQAIATWAHLGQTDKNGYDYIDHPKAVFYRVFADDQFDYDGQIVAWLHDTLEDTTLTPSDLHAFFPEYIVRSIQAITFNKWLKDAKPSETRDEYYLRVKADPIALRVKFQDIAHNMSPKRLDRLDQATRLRLLTKYTHALAVLNN